MARKPARLTPRKGYALMSRSGAIFFGSLRRTRPLVRDLFVSERHWQQARAVGWRIVPVTVKARTR